MRVSRACRAFGLAASLIICCWPAAAQATFPGQNGKIAFGSTTAAGTGIHVIEPDGTGLRLLIPGGWDPAWSATGTRLAFQKFGVGVTQGLFVANGDGSEEALLRAKSTSHPTPQTQREDLLYEPAWTPDGGTIAYTAEDRLCAQHVGCFDTPLGIRAIAPDGSGDRLLVDELAFEPAYSPDGTRIAWADHDIVVPKAIHVSNADGTGDTVLTQSSPSGDGTAREPSWSPDSTRIAFARRVGNDFEIHVMNADGGDLTRLTNSIVHDGDPVWSPDGTKIAWSHGNRLWVMNADGSEQAPLAPDPDIRGAEADWQPVVGPRRENYKNSSHFCKAEREFLGDEAFAQAYGSHGGCVSGSQRK